MHQSAKVHLIVVSSRVEGTLEKYKVPVRGTDAPPFSSA
jgi:hypothetical protein